MDQIGDTVKGDIFRKAGRTYNIHWDLLSTLLSFLINALTMNFGYEEAVVSNRSTTMNVSIFDKCY